MTQTPNNLAAESWAIADLLRGDFKQSQYGRIILPFCLLRRLECVLADIKDAVLAEYGKIQDLKLPEEAEEKKLIHAIKRTTGRDLAFFNTSKMDLGKLGEAGIKANLENYIQSFSRDAREIFEYFNFAEFVGQLNDANLLYKVVQKVRTIDLSPKAVSNHDMGLVFEELIRRFAEGSNETAGEHFTPRDIVRLTTALVFMEDDAALTKPGIIRTIYDPTAGSGGFLSKTTEYVHELNPHAVVRTFGQELNSESYAICKAAMLLKGQEVSNIKLGNTLSNDQFYHNKFDYILSNPPLGIDWKRIQQVIIDEHALKGFDGRFGPGLPRVSDGSLLFVLHAISKLKPRNDGGGKAALFVNKSALTTGGVGSGESEIRRFLIEQDLLEAIIVLPDGMLFNTSIQIYLLIFSNKKSESHRDKVQLIDASNLGLSIRSRIGSKSTSLDQESVNQILNLYAKQSDCEISKIIDRNALGYREFKISLTPDKSDFEKVPLDKNYESYLEESLNSIYRGYKVDATYCDTNDGGIGKVGYEFPVKRFFLKEDDSGKQFRFYFEEAKDDWLFAISKSTGNVIFTEIGKNLEKSKYYFFRAKETFHETYLKYFFCSESWRQWLKSHGDSGTASLIGKYELNRRKIFFPPIKSQKKIADLLEDLHLSKKRLEILESDLWIDPHNSLKQAQFKLPIQQDVVSRLIDLLPYPLANILHHYRSLSQDSFKDRYEILLKMIESLSILIASLLVSCIENDFGESEAQKFLVKEKQYLKNATFGTWCSFINLGKEKYEKSATASNFLLLQNIFESELLDLLETAKNIRNSSLGHGSYPTKGSARSTFMEVEGIFNRLTVDLAEIFANHILIRPLSTSWNGVNYKTICDEFSGLGANPYGITHVESKTPLITGELYLISKTNSEQHIKLFPFVRLMDISHEYGIESFYFYSRIDDTSSSIAGKNFLYISHQQIAQQSQYCTNQEIERLFQ